MAAAEKTCSIGRLLRGRRLPFAFLNYTPQDPRWSETFFPDAFAKIYLALARKYGVSASTIRDILTGRAWRHVA